MAERTVLLSSYANGVIEGLDGILNSDEYLSRLPRINTPLHCLRLLLLCGARRFQVSGFDRVFKDSVSAFSRMGWRPYNEKEWVISKVVTNTFDQYLPLGWQFEQEYAPVNTLVAFLEELLVASQRKVSIVTLLPAPSRDELKGLVPAELLGPLSILLNRIKHVEIDGPMPVPSLLRKYARELRGIFESPEYGLLGQQHHAAESSRTGLSGAVSGINKAARRVIERFKEAVDLRKVAVGTLTTTADLVGESFGNIAGSLAKAGAKALSALIQMERRVLIYELTPQLDQLVDERRLDYERARG